MNFMFLTLTTGVTYFLLLTLRLLPQREVLSYLPWLLLVFSFPHFMLTYVVWGKSIRSLRQQIWPVVFPFVYVGIFLSGLVPIFVLVKLSYIYLMYHFAQQVYGVGLWMLRGEKISKVQRWMLRGALLLSALYALLDMERRGVTRVLFLYETPLFHTPEWLITASFSLALLLLSVAFAGVFYRYFKTQNMVWMYLLATLGLSFVWFIPPLSYDFVFFLPLLHGLQFYPFAYLKLKGLGALKVALIFSGCLLFGWGLFKWLPVFGLESLGYSGWPVLILTLLNNHHFVIEGRIWKLRDPKNGDLLVVN